MICAQQLMKLEKKPIKRKNKKKSIREDFFKQKIAWASVGETYYSLIPEGTFLLDTNYFFSTEDSWFLGFLNSKLIMELVKSKEYNKIDQLLYKLYNLSEEETIFIESI